MFKRGDIIKAYEDGPPAGIIFEAGDKANRVLGFDNKYYRWESFRTFSYTGPIYEKSGQRFVPSGEFREPEASEWFIGDDLHTSFMKRNTFKPLQAFKKRSGDDGFSQCHAWKLNRIILLPVPELEPEHEFKVGDWVKFDDKDVMQIYDFDKTKVEVAFCHGGGKYGNHIDRMKKLPGRPLTTDDLMRVLSGEKVMVECHACGCKGVKDTLNWQDDGKGLLAIHHGGYVQPIALAGPSGLVFTDDVEGNIFVVEE